MAPSDTVSTPKKESGKAVDKRPPDFSLDELLAQLRPEECEGGYTYRELCEQAGIPQSACNLRKVRRRVNDRLAYGLWEKIGWKTHWSNLLKKSVTAEAFRPKKDEL